MFVISLIEPMKVSDTACYWSPVAAPTSANVRKIRQRGRENNWHPSAGSQFWNIPIWDPTHPRGYMDTLPMGYPRTEPPWWLLVHTHLNGKMGSTIYELSLFEWPDAVRKLGQNTALKRLQKFWDFPCPQVTGEDGILWKGNLLVWAGQLTLKRRCYWGFDI